MKAEILPLDLYLKSFNIFAPKSAFGITSEEGTFEQYFFVQTIIPKSFILSVQNNLNSYNIRNLPDEILIRFELFGKGNLNSGEAYVFKPWAAGIDDPDIYEIIESFILFMPCKLFYHMISFLIFAGRLNTTQFNTTRVLEDIPLNSFSLSGLHSKSIAQYFQIPNMSISRVNSAAEETIYKFCLDNDYNIKALRHKYFIPELNAWFCLTDFNETVGYIRLYSDNRTFTGGIHIEYVIAKSYRKMGYAKKAVAAIVQYLKECSYAFSIDAEVDESNTYSKNLLISLGFKRNDNLNAVTRITKTDFSLSLLGAIKELEEDFEDGYVDVSIEQFYIDKFDRYF